MSFLFVYRYDITAGTIVFCFFTALVLIASLLDAVSDARRRMNDNEQNEGAKTNGR